MKKIIFFIILSLLFINTCFAEEIHIVTKVIDGDTVIIDDKETVRLIGIDAPELRHSSKPVMYFAEEAYKFVKNLCEEKNVKLEFDEANAPSGHKDKYGRTLAYIYLEDGTFVNAEIIKQGYGFCYSRFPFEYIEQFRQYQIEAIEEERGLWKKVIYDSEMSNIVMNYKKLDEVGKETLREHLEYLTIKTHKGSGK